jgi:hypothetical protein
MKNGYNGYAALALAVVMSAAGVPSDIATDSAIRIESVKAQRNSKAATLKATASAALKTRKATVKTSKAA